MQAEVQIIVQSTMYFVMFIKNVYIYKYEDLNEHVL